MFEYTKLIVNITAGYFRPWTEPSGSSLVKAPPKVNALLFLVKTIIKNYFTVITSVVDPE